MPDISVHSRKNQALQNILFFFLASILAGSIILFFGKDRYLLLSLAFNFTAYLITTKSLSGKLSLQNFKLDFLALLIIQLVFRFTIWHFNAKYSAHGMALILEGFQIIVTSVFFYLKLFLNEQQHLISLLLFTLMPPFSILQGMNPGPYLYFITIFLIFFSLYETETPVRFDIIPVFFTIFLLFGIFSLFFTFTIVNTLEHIFTAFVFLMLFLLAQFISEDKITIRITIPAFLFLVFQSFFYVFEFALTARQNSAINLELNSNLIGMSLEFTFFLTLLYFLHTKSLFMRLFFSLLGLAQFGIIYAIQSRASAGSIAIAVLFLALFIIFRGKDKFRRYIPLIPHAMAASIILIFISVFFLFEKDAAFAQRVILYKQSISGVMENPFRLITGTGDYGPYRFFRHVSIFENGPVNSSLRNTTIPLSHPHSDYLSVFYGNGIPGVMAYLFIVFTLLLRTFRSFSVTNAEVVLSAAVFSFLLHGLFEPVSTQFVTGAFFWIFAGILWSKNISGSGMAEFIKNQKTLFFLFHKLNIIFLISFFGAIVYFSAQRLSVQYIFEPVNILWARKLFYKNLPVSDAEYNNFKRTEKKADIFWNFFPVASGSYHIYALTLEQIIERKEPAFSEEQKNIMIRRIISAQCRSFLYDGSPENCRYLIDFIEKQKPSFEVSEICGMPSVIFRNNCAAINPYGFY